MTEKHLLSPRWSHSGLKASYSGVHHLTSNPVFKISKSLNLFLLYKLYLPPPFLFFPDTPKIMLELAEMLDYGQYKTWTANWV